MLLYYKRCLGVVQLAAFLHLDDQAHLVRDRTSELARRCEVDGLSVAALIDQSWSVSLQFDVTLHAEPRRDDCMLRFSREVSAGEE